MDYLEVINNWIETSGASVLKTVVFGIVFYWSYKIFLWRILKTVGEKKLRKKDREEAEQRIKTLTSVLTKTGEIIIVLIVMVLLTADMGVNIGPLMAGLGILGIGVGFGAQSLVKDIVNGIFILAEGQYSVDDIIDIAGKKGQVEKITLRKTTLRDLDGVVHHVPNSEITTASNMSQEWAKVNINIPVAYEEKINNVYAVLNKVLRSLEKDKDFKDDILGRFEILGVEKFGDSSIDIKIVGKTTAMKRWDVARELRRRVKEMFDEEGVEIPYPHRVVINKDVEVKVEKVKKRIGTHV